MKPQQLGFVDDGALTVFGNVAFKTPHILHVTETGEASVYFQKPGEEIKVAEKWDKARDVSGAMPEIHFLCSVGYLRAREGSAAPRAIPSSEFRRVSFRALQRVKGRIEKAGKV